MAHPAARLALLGLVAFILAASCTFPDVEYDMPCSVPSTCQKNAEACRNKGEGDQTACLAKCAMTPNGNCGECQTNFETVLEQCLELCEGCGAQNGCTNATESCKTHLGMP